MDPTQGKRFAPHIGRCADPWNTPRIEPQRMENLMKPFLCRMTSQMCSQNFPAASFRVALRSRTLKSAVLSLMTVCLFGADAVVAAQAEIWRSGTGGLEAGMEVRWTENRPPQSLFDRCEVWALEAGVYRAELSSSEPVTASNLWLEGNMETGGTEPFLIDRSESVRFRICRSGHVVVCGLSPAALGRARLTLFNEAPHD